MKNIILTICIVLCATVFSGLILDDDQLFAQYPAPPTGCCMQRDWLAGEWNKTELGFTECEELNRNRDNLDDLYQEKGYVWWDVNCNL